MYESKEIIWREIRAPHRLSYVEFQNIPYDGLGHHLVKGIHIITPAPGSIHQWLSAKLSRLIGNFAESNSIGEVLTAPYDVKFSDDSGFQPDIILIKKEDFQNVKKSFFDGIPLLIVEILSPGSKKSDYLWKRKLAEDFQVPEYWVVNPDEQLFDVFYIKEKKYLFVTFTYQDHLQSKLPELANLSIDLTELFDSIKFIKED